MDGIWYIFGCFDDMLNIVGKCIGLFEIEVVFIEIGEVVDVVVIVVFDDIKGVVVVCVCVVVLGVFFDEVFVEWFKDCVGEVVLKFFCLCEIYFVEVLFKICSMKMMWCIVCVVFLGEDFGDLFFVSNFDIMLFIVKLRKEML